jgi:hypothetical protein
MNLLGDENTVSFGQVSSVRFGDTKGCNCCFIKEFSWFIFESGNGVGSNMEEATIIRQRELANVYALIETMMKLFYG